MDFHISADPEINIGLTLSHIKIWNIEKPMRLTIAKLSNCWQFQRRYFTPKSDRLGTNANIPGSYIIAL